MLQIKSWTSTTIKTALCATRRGVRDEDPSGARRPVRPAVATAAASAASAASTNYNKNAESRSEVSLDLQTGLLCLKGFYIVVTQLSAQLFFYEKTTSGPASGHL